MKHQILISALLLWVIFANSCKKDLQPLTAELIPIKASLNAEPFTFDVSKTDSMQWSWLWNVITINSIEQLAYPFQSWGLEVPDTLKRFDYEKFTFLLRFDFDSPNIKGIKHQLFRNIETGQYTYYQGIIYYNGEEYGQGEMGFFYTGILVDKMAEAPVIKVVKSASVE
jgi:hypothetical protein